MNERAKKVRGIRALIRSYIYQCIPFLSKLMTIVGWRHAQDTLRRAGSRKSVSGRLLHSSEVNLPKAVLMLQQIWYIFMEPAIEMSCETRPAVSKARREPCFGRRGWLTLTIKPPTSWKWHCSMSKWPIDYIDKWITKAGNIEARRMGYSGDKRGCPMNGRQNEVAPRCNIAGNSLQSLPMARVKSMHISQSKITWLRRCRMSTTLLFLFRSRVSFSRLGWRNTATSGWSHSKGQRTGTCRIKPDMVKSGIIDQEWNRRWAFAHWRKD